MNIVMMPLPHPIQTDAKEAGSSGGCCNTCHCVIVSNTNMEVNLDFHYSFMLVVSYLSNFLCLQLHCILIPSSEDPV